MGWFKVIIKSQRNCQIIDMLLKKHKNEWQNLSEAVRFNVLCLKGGFFFNYQKYGFDNSSR